VSEPPEASGEAPRVATARPSTIALMVTTSALVDRWRRTREGTIALARAVPPEHFDWRPHADAFSCGDIIRHLILAEQVFRLFIEASGRGEDWDPWKMTGPGEERLRNARPMVLEAAGMTDLGTTLDHCIELWAAQQAETEAVLAAVPDDALARVVEHPALALRAPLWEMFLLLMEHEIHHRGQLSAYLKMLRVEQPAMLMR
jgi:hypothetical protein